MSVFVDAWELRYQDKWQNSDKFYRVYCPVDAPFFVVQWGKRGGVGQFQLKPADTARSARDAAMRQIEAKEQKGYDHHSRVRFDVPDTMVGSARAGQPTPLISVLDRSFMNAQHLPPGAEPPEPSQARAKKEEKAVAEMEATLLALRSKLKAKPEPTQPEPTSDEPAAAAPAGPAPGSMEARLAEALARQPQHQ